MAQPARVKFITKKGDWVTETCHDILTCREHKAAVERTRTVLNATDKNMITILDESELTDEADSPRSVSFEEYNRPAVSDEQYNDSDMLSDAVLSTEGDVPQYLLNNMAEIVYHMEDVTFYNESARDFPELYPTDEDAPDYYDAYEPTLGDLYRHPELGVGNEEEVADLVTNEFNLFGKSFGFEAETMARAFVESDHAITKITDPQGKEWAVDFNAHSYDKEIAFPWIVPFDVWNEGIGRIVGDEDWNSLED